jgi:ferritin-like metal-binding protein YciE
MASKKNTTSTASKKKSTPKSGSNGNSELQKLLLDQLADIYYAEKKLLKALPKMAKATKHEELSQAFKDHAEQTEQQIVRLEQAFEELGVKAKGKTCEAMDGLIEEANGIKSEFEDSTALDAALIAAAQKVEHYEIASYGCMVTWADQLGLQEVADLLRQNLEEEKQTDEDLTSIAESNVNEEAE